VPDDQWSWELPKRAQSSGDESSAAPAANPQRRNRRAERTPRRAARAADSQDFGRTVALTIAGTVVPGLGLIAANRRRAGGIVLGLFLALIIGIGLWALLDFGSLVAAAVNPTLLKVIGVLLAVLGLVWVCVVVATHLSLSRGPLPPGRRIAASVLVGVLAFLVAAPMAVAARYSYDQAGLVSTVFQGAKERDSATRPSDAPTHRRDPWANKPRVNVLLLGSDAGRTRYGTRTDTVMVASIDTKTGDTTLVSLPRNTANMPFPEDSPLAEHYPYGFGDGNGDNPEFFLNAMYGNLPATVEKDVLGKTDDLGADALKLSVGAATGLKIDYYVMINLAGFRELINALGGITVNINSYVAIGGDTDRGIPPSDWLEPGADQHLDGEKALWFARGRYGSDDYQRMDRQRCVVNAIIDQANPANVLTRYEAIAGAGKQIVQTDIPQEALPAFVTLATTVKSDGNVRSLVFKHGVHGFISGSPDFDLMREQVHKSIGETKKPPKKSGGSDDKKDDNGDSNSDGSASASPSAQSESTDDACAWQPEVAASAQPPR
jgi:LCP family protein required for cell wall assembly